MSDPSPHVGIYPKPGEVLEGKYEVQRILGEGAMGAVIRATHVLRRAPVALKFMSPSVMKVPGVVDRFLNEGVAVSQIDSDHVVKIFDVSKLESGQPYLVMEYLEGEDLRDLLDREGKPGIVSVPRCIHFILQILRGLQVAHRAGIVHRDMKPANCFVTTKDGEPDFVKLVDFGISKLQQPDAVHLTDAGTSLGTPLYMSPEQARSPKDVDERCDLYAAATILYELISGRTPFVPESGTLTELLFKLGMEEPPRLETLRRDIPDGLADVIHHGLEKKPDHRFQTAISFAESLAPYADDRSSLVLARMLHRRTGGFSAMPPAPGPPTQVDLRRPTTDLNVRTPTERISVRPPHAQGGISGHHSNLAQGTQPMTSPPPAMSTAVMPGASGTGPGRGQMVQTDAALAVAETAISHGRDVTGRTDPGNMVGAKKTSPMVFIGVAMGAGALVAAGVFLGGQNARQATPPTPDSNATTLEPTAEPTVDPAPTSEPTNEVRPDASALVPPPPSATASAKVKANPVVKTPPPGSTKPTLRSIVPKD